MGKLSGPGAKSGCGFFILKSKMASKMAAKNTNFDNIPYKSGKIAIKCIYSSFPIEGQLEA